MPAIEKSEILRRLRAKIDNKQIIIGGGAGTGLSAKCEEQGGADLMVIYNSGRYRMAGRGSLSGYMSYGNANDIVCEMAKEVLPVVKNTPVLAGVNGTDPFMIVDKFLDDLTALGFSGIQNFPTVGIIDGKFRQGLEDTGMGYELEVDLVAQQRELEGERAALVRGEVVLVEERTDIVLRLLIADELEISDDRGRPESLDLIVGILACPSRARDEQERQ